jgi:beta-glucosidase-like glycosyl hydrolase
VLAVEAGCDGLLMCGADHDLQAAALEALIHAAEDQQLRLTRLEDALERHQRAKERFLTAPVAARPAQARELRQRIGRDDHRAIADEMSRFL